MERPQLPPSSLAGIGATHNWGAAGCLLPNSLLEEDVYKRKKRVSRRQTLRQRVWSATGLGAEAVEEAEGPGGHGTAPR